MFRPKASRILCLIGFTVSLAVAGCSSGNDPQAAQRGRAGGGRGNWPGGGGEFGGMQQAVPVEVSTPFRSDLASYVFGNANIEALREVEVVARVNGLLERLSVEEGDQVKSGQVLAELDKREFTIAQAEARARLENAKSVYERNLRMLEQQLTSQELVDRAKYDFESAQAQLDRARLNLEYATITAPISGVLTQRLVERGGLIRTNTVLFHMADTETLLVRLFVPEKELGRVNLGDKARIETAIFPGENFTGEVEMISPVVDPATGTVKVTVRVTQGRERLKPGMFCSVYILIETLRDALVISRKALIPETESPEVFVVDDSSRAHRRRLTLGISQGDTVEVVRGVAEKERIVMIGQEGLNENTPVRVVSEGTDSIAAPDSLAGQRKQWPSESGQKGSWPRDGQPRQRSGSIPRPVQGQ